MSISSVFFHFLWVEKMVVPWYNLCLLQCFACLSDQTLIIIQLERCIQHKIYLKYNRKYMSKSEYYLHVNVLVQHLCQCTILKQLKWMNRAFRSTAMTTKSINILSHLSASHSQKHSFDFDLAAGVLQLSIYILFVNTLECQKPHLAQIYVSRLMQSECDQIKMGIKTSKSKSDRWVVIVECRLSKIVHHFSFGISSLKIFAWKHLHKLFSAVHLVSSDGIQND